MVLVAGGFDTDLNASASAELYDPASGTWTATGSLNTARYYHTATLLPNGMVLVAGGLDILSLLPRARNCTIRRAGPGLPPAASTPHATSHTATLLPNGMVLVAGGFDSTFNASASAELYDPASGTWTATGSLNTARVYHTATLLPNGMVLVAGGHDSPVSPLPTSARNSTIRRAGPGLPRAASTRHALITRRRCCPTAWSLLQGDVIAASILLRARNCTIRRAGPGLSRAASTPHAGFTRRPCCPTAWSLLQREKVANQMLLFRSTPTVLAPGHWGSRVLSSQLRARNSTLLRRLQPQHRHRRHARGDVHRHQGLAPLRIPVQRLRHVHSSSAVISPIDEANGPVAKQLQCVCHDTLLWLISVSLDANARRCRHVIAVRGHRC